MIDVTASDTAYAFQTELLLGNKEEAEILLRVFQEKLKEQNMICAACGKRNVDLGHTCETGSTEDAHVQRKYGSGTSFCGDDCATCVGGCIFLDLKHADTESNSEFYG